MPGQVLGLNVPVHELDDLEVWGVGVRGAQERVRGAWTRCSGTDDMLDDDK